MSGSLRTVSLSLLVQVWHQILTVFSFPNLVRLQACCYCVITTTNICTRKMKKKNFVMHMHWEAWSTYFEYFEFVNRNTSQNQHPTNLMAISENTVYTEPCTNNTALWFMNYFVTTICSHSQMLEYSIAKNTL